MVDHFLLIFVQLIQYIVWYISKMLTCICGYGAYLRSIHVYGTYVRCTLVYVCMVHTVVPRYSAPDWEMTKSMLYQNVHYIEVQYNIT